LTVKGGVDLQAEPVWIIGSDLWPRAYLRAELIERGYDAIGFVTLRDAIINLTVMRSRRPSLIIFDLHDQTGDEKLVARLFRHHVPVVAIAGATEAADERLLDHPWAAFLRRPITIGAVADSIGALPEPHASARAP